MGEVTSDFGVPFFGGVQHLHGVGGLCLGGELPKFFGRLTKQSRKQDRRRRDEDGESGVEVPDHIHWPIWRVVLNEHMAVGLIEVETQWSLNDLCDANDLLDLIEEQEKKAIKKAKK